MKTKDLYQIVERLRSQYRNASAWDIYWMVTKKDDSVTQRRVAGVLKEIDDRPELRLASKIKVSQRDNVPGGECNCECAGCDSGYHCHKKSRGCNF